jgi:hypothetical protein
MVRTHLMRSAVNRSVFTFLTMLLTFDIAAAVSIDSDAGSTGYKFLQVPPDARSAALAQATTSAGGNVAALISNPAGLAYVDGIEVAATHVEWLASVRNDFVGLATPAWDGVIGVAFRTLSSGDIPLRGSYGADGIIAVPTSNSSGVYGVYDAALVLGYARTYGDISLGAGVKGIWEKIYLSSATAWAFDIGMNWRRNNLSLGSTVRNIGISGTLRDESTALPWDAVFGAGYDYEWAGTLVRAGLDLRYAPDHSETLHTGIEATFSRTLTGRIGYRRAIGEYSSTDGVTTGFGIALGTIAFDYAYIPIETGLESEHLFTVIFTP